MVLIFQRTLTKFRIGFFEKLAQNIDYVLCFYKKDKGACNCSNLNFKYEYVSGYFPFKNKPSLGFLFFGSSIKRHKPSVVIVEFDLNILTLWYLLWLKKQYKFELVLWTQGYSVKKDYFDPKSDIVDKCRLWWYKKADKIIIYMPKGKKYVGEYLNDANKIIVAYNTIDTDKLNIIRKDLQQKGFNSINKEYSLQGYVHNILYIGRLDKRKNPERLLDVIIAIRESIPKVALHYIGEGECRAKIEKRINQEQLEGVYLWGAIHDDREVSKFLYLSDLVIIPGHLGLAANHSFSMLTPIVTVVKGHEVNSHGPEIEYLEDGKNGFICLKISDIADIAIKYLEDPKLEAYMENYIADKTLNMISISNMVNAFVRASEINDDS